MPRKSKQASARKGNPGAKASRGGSQARSFSGAKKATLVVEGLLPKAETKCKPKGRSRRATSGASRVPVLTGAVLPPSRVVPSRSGFGAGQAPVTYCSYVFDVLSNAGGQGVPPSLTVTLPNAGTLATGASNCMHLGPWLFPRHATMAGVYQLLRVLAVSIEYEPLVGTSTAGLITGAILREYDPSTFVPANYGVNEVTRWMGAREFAPWTRCNWSWKPSGPLENVELIASANEADSISLRSDGRKYLFMLAGQGLPANTVLGKIRVRVHMVYRATA